MHFLESNTGDSVSALQHTLENKRKCQQRADIEIQQLEKDCTDLTRELGSIEDDLKSICIQKRNANVKHRMEVEYVDGLKEYEEEMIEEGAQTSAPFSTHRGYLKKKAVAIFCVCAKAYQKIQGRFALEQLPQGFFIAEETQMPQMITHCIDYTLPARERLANFSLDDINRFRSRMRGWAQNTIPDKQITMREKRLLAKCFREQADFRKEVCIC